MTENELWVKYFLFFKKSFDLERRIPNILCKPKLLKCLCFRDQLRIQQITRYYLTVIWVGFLVVHFEVVGGKITPWLKPLELGKELEIRYVGTYTYLVSVNIPFSIKTALILLMSAFFAKNQHFLEKIVPLLKATVWELC